ncbi:MAG: hypothetical protein PWQ50_710 [Methanolobus sp.]|jgi:hypothetical protein|nr:hypothetical protein [Methanolobus sp.]
MLEIYCDASYHSFDSFNNWFVPKDEEQIFQIKF